MTRTIRNTTITYEHLCIYSENFTKTSIKLLYICKVLNDILIIKRNYNQKKKKRNIYKESLIGKQYLR